MGLVAITGRKNSLNTKAITSPQNAFVNSQVAPYKKIREVRFLDAMPTNATGKTNRLALMAMLKEEKAAGK